MKQSGIYRIRNTENGHSYIGSSVFLERRKAVHWSMLKHGSHFNCYLQRAWNFYGAAAFVFEVVELCDRKELVSREQFHIDLGPEYNLCQTAEVAGSAPWTEERKKAFSERMKGNSYLLGKKHSLETRARISESNRGRAPSELARKKARQRMIDRNKNQPPRKGVPCSEEHRRKLSEVRKSECK